MKTTLKLFKNCIVLGLFIVLISSTTSFAKVGSISSGGGSSSFAKISTPSTGSTIKATPVATIKTSTPTTIKTVDKSGSSSAFANAGTPTPKTITPTNDPNKGTPGGNSSFVNAGTTPTKSINTVNTIAPTTPQVRTVLVSKPVIIPVTSVKQVRIVYSDAPASWEYTGDYRYRKLYYQASLLNAITDAAQRAELIRMMHEDASYATWRADAAQNAANNPELQKELALAEQRQTNTVLNTGFLIIGIVGIVCLVGWKMGMFS